MDKSSKHFSRNRSRDKSLSQSDFIYDYQVKEKYISKLEDENKELKQALELQQRDLAQVLEEKDRQITDLGKQQSVYDQQKDV